MKRILAAAAALASASMWLAGGPAGPAGASIVLNMTSIRVVPGWTYQGGGKIAVIVGCPAANDLPVVFSRMLRGPVDMRKGGNLLIDVTDKTRPGTYGIELVCEVGHGQDVAFGEERVSILERLPGWNMPPQPSLPANFKPDVTVQTGPPPKPKKHSAKR